MKSDTPQKKSERPLCLLIADDNPSARAALRALLESAVESDRPMALLEAKDGQAALEVADEAQPDVVLLDVEMPRRTGIEATRLIKARWPAMRVVVLTMHQRHRLPALAAGADAFLLKGCPPERLLAAIFPHSQKGEDE